MHWSLFSSSEELQKADDSVSALLNNHFAYLSSSDVKTKTFQYSTLTLDLCVRLCMCECTCAVAYAYANYACMYKCTVAHMCFHALIHYIGLHACRSLRF